MRVTVPTRVQVPDVPWELWKPQLEDAMQSAMHRVLPRAMRALLLSGHVPAARSTPRIAFVWRGGSRVMAHPHSRHQLEAAISRIVTRALETVVSEETADHTPPTPEPVAE